MDKFDRIYAMHKFFSSRRMPASMQMLCDELECAPATVKRGFTVLQDIMGAPLLNVRGQGWKYDHSQHFELPGLWFNRQELEALLTLNHLLAQLGPGLLENELAPLRSRLQQLQRRLAPQADHEADRIRILEMGRRTTELPHFMHVAASVIERKRLNFQYLARSSGNRDERQVSPQRLVHYRGNWYLDAFCHRRDGLRTFSLDCMEQVKRLREDAQTIASEQLDRELAGSYGIFSGRADQLAVLRFTPQRARWIAGESWHPEQQGAWLDDGAYELRLPYHNDTELILDICRYGPDVEVIEPPELRQAVAGRLRLAAKTYD